MLNLIAGAVVTIVFLAVMIPIGMGISNNVLTAYDRSTWTTQMNSTATQLQAQTSSAFSLFTILPLVIGAGIIITVLFAVFRARGD